MDGSRSERARARALHLLAQIAPLPDDSEVQRLRELSLDYIREAERLERAPEPGEQISAVLDTGMCARSLLGNREISWSASASPRAALARVGKARSRSR